MRPNPVRDGSSGRELRCPRTLTGLRAGLTHGLGFWIAELLVIRSARVLRTDAWLLS